MDQAINLSKGGTINLTKSRSLRNLIVGLGWAINPNYQGPDHDFDISAFLCQEINGAPQLLSNSHFIFYNNKKSPDGALVHSGDVRQGAANVDPNADIEQIKIDLDRLDPRIEEISFVLSLDDAKRLHQNFGQVAHAHIRIVDADANKELARYTVSNEFKDEIGLQFGSLLKTDGEWEFTAIGAAGPQELVDFVLGYGGTV